MKVNNSIQFKDKREKTCFLEIFEIQQFLNSPLLKEAVVTISKTDIFDLDNILLDIQFDNNENITSYITDAFTCFSLVTTLGTHQKVKFSNFEEDLFSELICETGWRA